MVVMETETETEARSSSPPSYLSSEEVTDSGITVNSIKENTDQEIRNEGSGWLISWLCIHNKLRKGNKHERWKAGTGALQVVDTHVCLHSYISHAFSKYTKTNKEHQTKQLTN